MARVGEYVIVRGMSSGAFAGTLVSRDGSEVTLDGCRRLWRWDGAASLSQLAAEGVSRPSGCKFPPPIDGHLVLDAIEVMTATGVARKSIEEVPPWRA